MLPDGHKMAPFNGGLRWIGTRFKISFEEAEAISKEVRKYLSEGKYEFFLVDNRQAKGTWPQDVKEVWAELMPYIFERVNKIVTLTPNMTNKMAINNLAKRTNTYDKNRAFVATEMEQASAFIGFTLE